MFGIVEYLLKHWYYFFRLKLFRQSRKKLMVLFYWSLQAPVRLVGHLKGEELNLVDYLNGNSR